MMKFPRSAPAILIVSGALLLSATGGAVAAGMITSAQTKDNTIKSVDVGNGTLKKLTGAVIDWISGVDPVTIRAYTDSSVRAFGSNNTGVADNLILTIFCALLRQRVTEAH